MPKINTDVTIRPLIKKFTTMYRYNGRTDVASSSARYSFQRSKLVSRALAISPLEFTGNYSATLGRRRLGGAPARPGLSSLYLYQM